MTDVRVALHDLHEAMKAVGFHLAMWIKGKDDGLSI